ncbi:hypothetical protein I316_05798 [Kwoniella heveanensis BCC8398]|uniref:F-box domain-containing protein n=1 Tax=Kwoniella heveanensis BCC8398 TaxID=1296120 RepID=A0A1B9GNL7_9TREE|nr:hypothetical protein I316_05798 [Kwoniella heveanensis BCC8398]
MSDTDTAVAVDPPCPSPASSPTVRHHDGLSSPVLPEDVLLKIPSYVSHRPTLAAISMTCKQLHKVCTPLVWEHLVLGPRDYVPPALRLGKRQQCETGVGLSSNLRVESGIKDAEKKNEVAALSAQHMQQRALTIGDSDNGQDANLRYVKKITIRPHCQHFCQPLRSPSYTHARIARSRHPNHGHAVQAVAVGLNQGQDQNQNQIGENGEGLSHEERERRDGGQGDASSVTGPGMRLGLGPLADVDVVEIRIDEQYDYHQVPLVPVSLRQDPGIASSSPSSPLNPTALMISATNQVTSPHATSAPRSIPGTGSNSNSSSTPGLAANVLTTRTSNVTSLPRRFDDPLTTNSTTAPTTSQAATTQRQHAPPHIHTARCRPAVSIEPCHILRAIDPKTLILRYPDYPLSKLPERRHPRLEGLKPETLIVVTPANSVLGGSPILQIGVHWRRSLRRIVWIFIPSKPNNDSVATSGSGAPLALDYSKGKRKANDIHSSSSSESGKNAQNMEDMDKPKPTKGTAKPSLNRPALYNYFYDAGKCIKYTRAKLTIVNGDHLVRQATVPKPSSNLSGMVEREAQETDHVDTGFMERALRKGLQGGHETVVSNNPVETPSHIRDTQGEIRFITLDEYLLSASGSAATTLTPEAAVNVGGDWRDVLDIDDVQEWCRASR